MTNVTNIQDVQKAGLQKKEFVLSLKTTHNGDYCLLFNLNLMVVRVVQTHRFQSLRVSVPCH